MFKSIRSVFVSILFVCFSVSSADASLVRYDTTLVQPMAQLGKSDAAAVNGNTAFVVDSKSDTAIFYQLIADQWTEVARFTDDPITVGPVVAIEGDHAMLGELRDGTFGVHSGKVKFFRRIDGIWQHTNTLFDPDAHLDLPFSSEYGADIIIDGNRALIKSGTYAQRSSIRLYEFSDNNWRLTSELKAEDEGFAFDTLSFKGNNLAIGGQHYLSDAREGAVYIYRLQQEGWQQVQKILPHEKERFFFFADSVAINDHHLLVGSSSSPAINGTDSGVVFVYANTTGRWTHVDTLSASNGIPSAHNSYSGGRFGTAITLEVDSAVITGSRNSYLYSLTNNQFSESAILTYRPTTADYPARASFDGSFSIMPAGSYDDTTAYLFDFRQVVQSVPLDSYGNVVSETGYFSNTADTDSATNPRIASGSQIPLDGLASNGNTALVRDNRMGNPAVDVYEYAAGIWSSSGQLRPAENEGDRFGWAVAVEGERAIVAATHSQFSDDTDTLYYYEKRGNEWKQKAIIEEPPYGFGQLFGYALDLSGDYLAVSGPNVHSGYSEIVYLYKFDGEGWVLSDQLAGPEYEKFGTSLSLQGNQLIVGAPGKDKVYFYELNGNQWAEVGSFTLDIENAQYIGEDQYLPGSAYGTVVSINNDIAVVAEADAYEAAGFIDIYEKRNGQWVLASRVTASDGAAGDRFGAAVEIVGASVVVGAPGDNDKGNSSGSAYVLQRQNNNWTEVAKLVPGDGQTGDQFAESISSASDQLLVKATAPTGVKIYTFDLQAIAELPDDTSAGSCIDVDGDGWGWNGVSSCLVSEAVADCVDSDGDGWGWDGSKSCPVQAVIVSCIDVDGDGWGWNGVESCRAELPVCIDTDGDGWGWNGAASCRVK